jgi:hypothetical protein
MNIFRRKPSQEPFASGAAPDIKHKKRVPGHAADPTAVFEVWGDMLDCTDIDQQALRALAQRSVMHMEVLIRTLLDLPDSHKAVTWCSDPDDMPYLLIKWEGLEGEIGARPIGKCLDVFGVLIVRRGFGADPNPLVRLAKMPVEERRNLELFQSVLKYVLEQTLEALDEQRLI